MEHLGSAVTRALEEAGIDITRRPRGLLPDEPQAEVCGSCNGAGFLREDVHVSDPRFGVLIPCPTCKVPELETRRRQKAIGASGLEDHQHVQFDSQTLRPDDAQRESWRAAWLYAQDPKGFFWIEGPNGTGKTTLAIMIANHALRRGNAAVFRLVPDLLRDIRRTFDKANDASYDELSAVLRDPSVLIVLDDIGKENPTKWVNEEMFALINMRWFKRMPTVITSNKDITEFDPAIQSRVDDPNVCQRIVMQGR